MDEKEPVGRTIQCTPNDMLHIKFNDGSETGVDIRSVLELIQKQGTIVDGKESSVQDFIDIQANRISHLETALESSRELCAQRRKEIIELRLKPGPIQWPKQELTVEYNKLDAVHAICAVQGNVNMTVDLKKKLTDICLKLIS